MSANSTIEWTNRTWNPVRGCSIVSPGCTNCYAMRQAHRFSGCDQPYEGLTRITNHGPVWTGKIRLVPDALEEPLHWKKPSRIFVNSMSDLFHEDAPDGFLDRVFAVMALAPQHKFQVLTKRPERMRAYLSSHDVGLRWGAVARQMDDRVAITATMMVDWTRNGLPNVWLGVSAENQATADERIPILLQTPAAIRFVSLEPLLGSIGLSSVLIDGDENLAIDPLRGARPAFPSIDWVIVGGESGPNARPCNIDWIRSIVDQCKAADTRLFVKQLGANVEACDIIDAADYFPGIVRLSGASEHNARVHFRDRKGGDAAEWPEWA
ncbi:MAG: phage Gp37/Gp68 family protein, partial [Bradyrhizobium sp.]|nr:phage Gp37/Gp68 family protein [Bradyrhizobium sp.]